MLLVAGGGRGAQGEDNGCCIVFIFVLFSCRFWHREDNGCCWLLEVDEEHREKTMAVVLYLYLYCFPVDSGTMKTMAVVLYLYLYCFPVDSGTVKTMGVAGCWRWMRSTGSGTSTLLSLLMDSLVSTHCSGSIPKK